MDILHLPIKYETLIKKYYDKVQDKIEEIFQEEEGDYNLYKISKNVNVQEKINDTYSYIQGKYKIDDTVINISFNETEFDCKPNTIDISKIKLSKTDIACWWCCHKFDNYPISIPLKFYPENYLFKCKGIFCSFPCAYSYSCQMKFYDTTLLKMFYKKIVVDYKNTQINKAPQKEILKMFGGPIDINEFRNNSNNILYNINTYPVIYMNEQLHIQSIYGLSSNTSKKTNNKLNTYTIEQAKERLKTNKTIITSKTISEKLNQS